MAWARIYKLLWDNGIRLELRGFAREKGWEPRSPDSYRKWKANGYKKLKDFYRHVEGLGRWHLHATFVCLNRLNSRELAHIKAGIHKILGVKNRYNVSFENIYSTRENNNRYIVKNVAQTVVPRGFFHQRLLAAGEHIQNFEELFLSEKTSQTGSNEGFEDDKPGPPFKAYNIKQFIASLIPAFIKKARKSASLSLLITAIRKHAPPDLLRYPA